MADSINYILRVGKLYYVTSGIMLYITLSRIKLCNNIVSCIRLYYTLYHVLQYILN